jgi:hypothetical protein
MPREERTGALSPRGATEKAKRLDTRTVLPANNTKQIITSEEKYQNNKKKFWNLWYVVDLCECWVLRWLLVIVLINKGIERTAGFQLSVKAMSGIKIIIRPWSDFLSTSDVSVPKRADVLSERIRLNLNHWLGNYLCIVAAFVVLAGYL